MLERIRFSKPQDGEERPKLANKSFWWNNNSLDEVQNETKHENLVDQSNDAFLMSDSYEKYMETESKDIAKLHEKLSMLRKQLYSNLNENQAENEVEARIDNYENDDEAESSSSSNSSEIVFSKTKSYPSRPVVHIREKPSDKLPFNKSSKHLVKNKYDNVNIESLDAKAKHLIERR